MSFIKKVKEELLYRDKESIGCAIAEMHGMLGQNFKIHVSKNISLTIIKENSYYIKRFNYVLSKYFDEQFEIKLIKHNSEKRPFTYVIYFPNCENLLVKIYMLDGNKFIFNKKEVIATREHKIAYLVGEFFACGIFSDPNKNYHLEFRKSDLASAKKLRDLLNDFSLNAKIIERKSYFIVYVKEADKISDFLKLIGAYNSVLELESLIVLKDMKNNINRKQNCEMSNLNKTITASVKHCNDIEYIIDNFGINHIPTELREVAQLRIEYPDLSLVEIGQMADSPISKSSVNYKLKKISKIAYNLKGEV